MSEPVQAVAAGPTVVLVGPPGAGKTAVGKELAARLGTEFLDTDQLVETRAGKSVSDIFVDDGEPAFRALEQDAVAEALQAVNGVVSLGGGAVLAAATQSRLKARPVAFLDASLATAAQRVGLTTSRPLLLGNIRGQLKALLDARRPVYEHVATWRVATDDLTVAEVADEVQRLLASADVEP
jgi:shikimate kinase